MPVRLPSLVMLQMLRMTEQCVPSDIRLAKSWLSKLLWLRGCREYLHYGTELVYSLEV